jgi:hypothetical protein
MAKQYKTHLRTNDGLKHKTLCGLWVKQPRSDLPLVEKILDKCSCQNCWRVYYEQNPLIIKRTKTK